MQDYAFSCKCANVLSVSFCGNYMGRCSLCSYLFITICIHGCSAGKNQIAFFYFWHFDSEK